MSNTGQQSLSQRLRNLSDSKSYVFLGRGTTDGTNSAGGNNITLKKPRSTNNNHRSSVFSVSAKTNLARDDFLIFELVFHPQVDSNDYNVTPTIRGDSDYSVIYHHWTLRQLYRHVVSSIKVQNSPPVIPSPKPMGTIAQSIAPTGSTEDDSIVHEDTTQNFKEVRRPRSYSLSSSAVYTATDTTSAKSLPNDQTFHRRQHSSSSMSRHYNCRKSVDAIQATSNAKLLGSNLHPRDMRRLVTPFSASNEPELIVRRHVMVFNFDPLRAIITRDRLLVLVPTGADSILKQLEERIVGNSMEFQDYDDPEKQREDEGMASINKDHLSNGYNGGDATDVESGITYDKNNDDEHSDNEDTDDDDDDWSQMMMMEMDQQKDLTFELLCVNACLSLVYQMLADDTEELQEKGLKYVQDRIIGNCSGSSNNKTKQRQLRPEDALAVIRNLKNAVKVMQARVKGFVHSINRILNEDEDMALMNVSRLITHPENFVQPVSLEMLEIESDEPELVLESNLHNALTLSNALDLIQGQVETASDLIDARMDAARNKFLLASLCMSIASLSLTAMTCVGGIFGMNLQSGIEELPGKFLQVTCGSIGGSLLLGIAIFLGMIQTGVITGIGPVDKEGIDTLF